MDEIIMQVARTVACHARLRILSRLALNGELAPTRVASETGTPLDMVCTHLRRLTTVGLILRRRSGVWCYGVARSPYAERAFSGKVATWLFGVLKAPVPVLKQCGVGRIEQLSTSKIETLLLDVVFEAATAFTNVRRLQILRRLGHGGVASGETLSAELKMSPSAVCRHMGKLIRRGLVKAVWSGRSISYRLEPQGKTPVHGALFGLIRAEWRKR